MLLYEFAGPDPLKVKLVAVANQLKADIDQGKKPENWSVDELLEFFKQNDILLSKSDLYDMIKNPPLNKFISNIQGEDVIFKGQAGDMDVDSDPDQDARVVDQMAKKAMK